ncbi:uncharacterized protein [Aegilops tauschii subsp. strangulata]|uniref:uncharacterized protein isoform X3 n=1 Tax=Aegilops tauschii subsp. strangulata TaxID=200361 RepID=UPI001ABBFE0E|nr:uncharacterized protein LOC109787571 isoform X3 [Aegilops tauschii subsp. strangulata]
MYGSCNLHIHNSEAIELQSAHNPHRVVHLSVPFRGEEENFSGTSDFVAGRKALLEISELRCGFEQFCQEELASMFHLLGLELWFMEKSCMISQAPCGSFSFGDGTHGPICAFGNHWKNMRRLGSQVQLS